MGWHGQSLLSMFIIWARAGAVSTPLEPSKSIESSTVGTPTDQYSIYRDWAR